MYQPRIPIAYTSYDGTAPDTASQVFTFPLAEYEWQTEQGILAPSVALTGAHYEYDLLGLSRGVKQPATEALRFTFRATTPAAVDTAIEAAESAIARIGYGKLWAEDATGALRWSYARTLSFPTFRWQAGDQFRKAGSVSWRRNSDWYEEEGYDETFIIDANPKSFTVANPGSESAYNAVFILKGTFTNPVITNTTNGYVMQSTRDGSDPDHWLKFDAGRGRFYFSTDGGVTYAGDGALGSLGGSQVQMMIVEPDDNAFTIAGANGATLNVTFPIPHI